MAYLSTSPTLFQQTPRSLGPKSYYRLSSVGPGVSWSHLFIVTYPRALLLIPYPHSHRVPRNTNLSYHISCPFLRQEQNLPIHLIRPDFSFRSPRAPNLPIVSILFSILLLIYDGLVSFSFLFPSVNRTICQASFLLVDTTTSLSRAISLSYVPSI